MVSWLLLAVISFDRRIDEEEELKGEERTASRCCPAFTTICLASSEDRIEMPERTDDQQSSSTTISTSTTPAASPPSTVSSSQDIKPPAAGRKRALLCGVSTAYSGAGENIRRLEGPVNDVKKIKEMLIKFNYTDDQHCIRVLTEGDQEINGNELSATTPTKKNIEDSLKWLVEGAESGDSLVFFFSGHGLRQPESNHVCLVDCTGKGVIPNYDINSTMVRPLKKGVTLYAIVDACHSGSILDLNYVYNQQSNDWTDLSKADQRGTSGGLAICLSACRDDKNTPESNANSSELIDMGAMTYQLIEMVNDEKHPAKVTYEDVLKKMHDLHVRRNIEREPLVRISSSELLRKHSESQKIEEPVLSSSHEFQVSSEKFLQVALL